MRTSEAERQRVAEFLRDCCADGRLTPDELELRLDRLFAGGTVADIERLVWDLPGGDAVVPRLVPAARRPVVVRRRTGSPAAPAALVLIGLGAALAVFLAVPPVLQIVSLAILVSILLTTALLATAFAPLGLLLLGLAWLVNRLFRRPPHPHADGWGRRDGHPL